MNSGVKAEIAFSVLYKVANDEVSGPPREGQEEQFSPRPQDLRDFTMEDC